MLPNDVILNSKDKLTLLLKNNGIQSWNTLCTYIEELPYGGNTCRENFDLVITEKKGTCSSKHALLKTIADLNDIPKVKLCLGLYKMTTANTKKIGNTLSKIGLPYIPEAHCYLKINDKPFDFTTTQSDFSSIEKHLIEEKVIPPKEVISDKINFHKNFIRHWIIAEKIPFTFEEVWSMREQCISKLSK